MTSDLNSVPDTHRTNPANATRWSVTVRGTWTIVVATCIEEARLLALLWVATSQNRTTVDLTTRVTARPATDHDLDRWTTAREQQAAGLRGARSGA